MISWLQVRVAYVFENIGFLALAWAARFYHLSGFHDEEDIPRSMVELGWKLTVREARARSAGQN
jgi:hypothetical protein